MGTEIEMEVEQKWRGAEGDLPPAAAQSAPAPPMGQPVPAAPRTAPPVHPPPSTHIALFPFSLASSTPSASASSGGLRGEEGDIGPALPLAAAASAGCWRQLFWARIDGRRRHRRRRQRGQSTAGLRGRGTPGKNPTGCRGPRHDALSPYPTHCASREWGRRACGVFAGGSPVLS